MSNETRTEQFRTTYMHEVLEGLVQAAVTGAETTILCDTPDEAAELTLAIITSGVINIVDHRLVTVNVESNGVSMTLDKVMEQFLGAMLMDAMLAGEPGGHA